jgi:dihydrofolate synthase/folylpolyglutamate synthase
MNYTEKLSLLAKNKQYAQKPGLQKIKKVLKALGNPQNCHPIIHIAGTNGKGSTAAMLQAILVAAGYRVGLYTSPHFLDYRERIRINDELISRRDLARALQEVFKTAGAGKLTYFEVLTADSMLQIRRKINYLASSLRLILIILRFWEKN